MDDGAALVGRFRSGTLLTDERRLQLPRPLSLAARLELVGTRAMAVAHNTMGQTPGGTLRLVDAATGATENITVPPEEDLSPFRRRESKPFSRCLRAERTLIPTPPEHDLHTMRLLMDAAAAAAHVE